MDFHLRTITRLSAFQLSILNYVALNAPQDEADSDRAKATELAIDLSAHVMKSSMLLSQRTIAMRRDNALTEVKRQ